MNISRIGTFSRIFSQLAKIMRSNQRPIQRRSFASLKQLKLRKKEKRKKTGAGDKYFRAEIPSLDNGNERTEIGRSTGNSSRRVANAGFNPY